jgi:RNA polymerase sigma factor (sigma-70 family)
MAGPEFEAFFREHAGMAYGLALGVAGEPAAAEDAVQKAFMHLWRKDPDLRTADARAYLASAVINAARDGRRRDVRRRAREDAAAPAAVSPPEPRSDSAETRRAVRAALLGLSEDRRLPVLLHVVEDFSHREVARILNLPASTVTHRIGEGLEELRSTLARAGFAGLAGGALAATLQAGWRVSAPTNLESSLKTLTAKCAAKAGLPAATKGGLIVKIGLGVAAAGLVAGAAFWAVSGKTEEPAKAPESKTPSAAEGPAKPKFAIPCWDPEARWAQDPEPFMGSGALGYLDGPRREVMWHIIGGADASPIFNSDESYPYGFFSYDSATERVHVTAGGTAQRGWLDGPIVRARFGGFDYTHRVSACSSPDGRYYFFTEPYLKNALRRLDLQKQEVRTIYRDIPWEKQPKGMTCDSKGRLYMMLESGLQITDVDGKVEKTLALVKEEGPTFNWFLAIDEVHNRLYSAGGAQKKKWYVWYWDLADGSFHGVLPFPQPGEGRPDAVAMYPSAGPFKGTVLYSEMGCGFGPDDPEKNFLYLYPNDTNTIVRLDLKKEQVWLFSGEKEARWIPTGKPKNVGPWMHMDPEFNIVGYRPPWEGSQALRFKRVK